MPADLQPVGCFRGCGWRDGSSSSRARALSSQVRRECGVRASDMDLPDWTFAIGIASPICCGCIMRRKSNVPVSRVDATRRKIVEWRRFGAADSPRNCGNGGGPALTDYFCWGLIGFAGADWSMAHSAWRSASISTTAMLSFGLPPAQASAIVHTAEIFTTGASASSHIWHRNVDWRLVIRLGIAGVLGAVLGAWILSNVDAEHHAAVRRRLSGAARHLHPAQGLAARARARCARRRGSGRSDSSPAFSMRAAAAAGDRSRRQAWSAPGHAPRMAVGSVNTTEFFVTVAAATTFFVELGASPWKELLALIAGGMLAAPLGGWMVKHVPRARLMVAVGCLVIGAVALADRTGDEVGVSPCRVHSWPSVRAHPERRTPMHAASRRICAQGAAFAAAVPIAG